MPSNMNLLESPKTNRRSAVEQIEWDDLLLGIDHDEDSQIFSRNYKALLNFLTANLGAKIIKTLSLG